MAVAVFCSPHRWGGGGSKLAEAGHSKIADLGGAGWQRKTSEFVILEPPLCAFFLGRSADVLGTTRSGAFFSYLQ